MRVGRNHGDRECAEREQRPKQVYYKMRFKFEEYRGWYKEAERSLCEGSDVTALREELKRKYEELLASVELLNSL